MHVPNYKPFIYLNQTGQTQTGVPVYQLNVWLAIPSNMVLVGDYTLSPNPQFQEDLYQLTFEELPLSQGFEGVKHLYWSIDDILASQSNIAIEVRIAELSGIIQTKGKSKMNYADSDNGNGVL